MEEFKLNLNKHAWNKNIIISIIFSKLKNFLIKNNKEDIIWFIKYIKINDDNVYIKTQKPIINAELKIFEWEIKNMIKDIFWNFGILYKEFNLYFK
jgi:hypothetical protein